MFNTYGIHTRLKYIIERTDGIDKKLRREYLKNTYNLDDETLDVVLMYDVENLIKNKSIEEIKKEILNKKNMEKEKFEKITNTLKRMYLLGRGFY